MLISFRIHWFDLLAIQGTLKRPLQHQSSKVLSIFQDWDFFMVQLSHPYLTTGKTIALTRQTFVSKEMSLLFNSLSRLVMAFLPKSKHLLISWLQSPSTNIYSSFFLISRTSQQLKNPSMHKFWYLHTMARVYAKSLQSCPTFCDSMDYSPPGSFIHGILQAITLEWVAMPSSRRSSWPRDWTQVSYISCIGGQVLLPLAPPGKPKKWPIMKAK